jgi:hypothetical protein
MRTNLADNGDTRSLVITWHRRVLVGHAHPARMLAEVAAAGLAQGAPSPNLCVRVGSARLNGGHGECRRSSEFRSRRPDKEEP